MALEDQLRFPGSIWAATCSRFQPVCRLESLSPLVTMADSKVKDMSLAEFGRKELTLAEARRRAPHETITERLG